MFTAVEGKNTKRLFSVGYQAIIVHYWESQLAFSSKITNPLFQMPFFFLQNRHQSSLSGFHSEWRMPYLVCIINRKSNTHTFRSISWSAHYAAIASVYSDHHMKSASRESDFVGRVATGTCFITVISYRH